MTQVTFTGSVTVAGVTYTPTTTVNVGTAGNPLLPASGVLFGAWVSPVGGTDSVAIKASVLAWEAWLGRTLAIDQLFVPVFGAPSGWAWRLTWDAAAGRVPLLSFGTRVDVVDVANGLHDAEIQAFVDACRAFGKPVLLRYAGEMDGSRNLSWAHSGPAFVAAHKHVRAMFADLPVQWVWSPTQATFGGANGGADTWYPGDAFVDWIGVDGYNWYITNPGPWRNFSDVFAPFFAWAAKHPTLPLMVAEFGTTADPADANRKAQWLVDAGTCAAAHPQLKALVYFNSYADNSDWRLPLTGPLAASTAAALSAPVYLGTVPTT